MTIFLSFSDFPSIKLLIPKGWRLYHLMTSLGYRESLYFAIVENRIVPDTYTIMGGDKIEVHLVKLPISYNETLNLLSNNVYKNERQIKLSFEIEEYGMCDRCGSIPVINKRFLGSGLDSNHYSLCGECFSTEIEERVMRTILWYRLVKKGDRIFIPLSGEKDSATVVYFLSKFKEKVKDSELLAYTVDEGVGTYSQVRIEKAKSLCSFLGVHHRIDSFKERYGYTLLEMIELILERGISLQHHPCYICNVLKNKIFQEAFRKYNCTKVAGSNNLTDQAERVLIALLYGMFDFTCSVGTKIYDPSFQATGISVLSEIEEKEIALYSYLNEIPHHRHEDCACNIPRMKEAERLQNNCWHYKALGRTIRDSLSELEQGSPGTILWLIWNYKKYYSDILQKKVPSPISRQCTKCGRQFISRRNNKSMCDACYILEHYKLG